MTVPHWRRSSSLGEIRVDAAVVGAGVAGVSAALALQRLGKSVVVLERHTLASGASGRNAGFLMRGAADNYAAAIRDWGRDSAAALWRLTEDNLAGLRAQGVESLNSYRPVPSCLLALTESEADELREAAALLTEDAFDVSLRHSGADAAWRSGKAIVGLVNPHDASCNPHELLRFLASRLDRPLMEGQEVHAIDSSSADEVLVPTTDALIRAQRVVVCSNAYTDLVLPNLAGLIAPNRGQMLALRVPGVLLDCSYYANHGSEYFRQSDPATIVVGGKRKTDVAGEQTSEDSTTATIQNALEQFAESMLGARYPVIARWSGIMGFTRDGLPLVGPVDPTGRVWLCAGFTGHGMSMAFRTADIAVRAMLHGTENPFPLSRAMQWPRQPPADPAH